MQKLNLEYVRTDSRGTLTQVNTGEWKQFNYLVINKGKEFGGHYHKYKRELFYVTKGLIEFLIWNAFYGGVSRVFIKQGECLLVEPNDYHKLYASEDSEIIELLSEPFSKEDIYE